MIHVTLVGLAAALLTTIAFIPQVLKTYREKSARDISLTMYIIFTTGITFWLVYGILKNDIPIILANIVTLGLASSVLFMKVKYSKNDKKEQNL